MQIKAMELGFAAVAVAMLVAGAYTLGKGQSGAGAASSPAQVAATDKPAPATATGPVAAAGTAGGTAMPPAHPPLSAGTVQPSSAQPPQEVREGKVSVDPSTKFTHFRVGNRNVKALYADGPRMWVATSGGVIRYDTKTDQFKMFDARSGLLSNGMFYVGRVKGRIAVGTYGGGLSLLDESGEKWETFNVPDGLGDAFVYDVLETANGDLWIATWSGVNRVRGGNLRDRSKWELHTVESTKGGLPNDWVYGLAEGKNGEIWLATEGGLARFRAGAWDNWNHAKGLGAPYEKVKSAIAFKSDPSRESMHHARQKQEMGLQNVDVAYNPNYVVSIEVDRQGVVWVGTWGGGLSRFDGKTWKSYTTAEGLPGNHVFMLHVDAKGALWVGTNNGLALMRGEKFERMSVSDGLFADNVFSMTTTKDGSLWVGSYGGVAQIREHPLK